MLTTAGSSIKSLKSAYRKLKSSPAFELEMTSSERSLIVKRDDVCRLFDPGRIKRRRLGALRIACATGSALRSFSWADHGKLTRSSITFDHASKWSSIGFDLRPRVLQGKICPHWAISVICPCLLRYRRLSSSIICAGSRHNTLILQCNVAHLPSNYHRAPV